MATTGRTTEGHMSLGDLCPPAQTAAGPASRTSSSNSLSGRPAGWLAAIVGRCCPLGRLSALSKPHNT